MANLKVVLELDNEGYIRNIRRADQATKDFANAATTAANTAAGSMSRLQQVSQKLGESLNGMRLAAAGVALAAFGRSAILAADQIVDIADATDFAIPKILELQEALQAAGGEAANAGKLIYTFFDQIGAAAGGADTAQKAFATVGISLEELASLSNEQLLREAITGLNNIEDPALRSAAATDLFGKAIKGVSPSALASELERLNGTFDAQAEEIRRSAELMGQFEQNMTKLRMAFLETFGPMITGFTKLIEILNKIPGLIEAISIAMLAIPGAAVARGAVSLFSFMAKGFDRITKGAKGAAAAAKAARESATAGTTTVGQALRLPQSTQAAQSVRNAASVIGAGGAVVAGATAAIVGNLSEQEAAEKKVGDEVQRTTQRKIEQGKEAKKALEDLAREMQAVRDITAAYREQVDLNESQRQLKEALIGKTQEEQELYKGVFEINQRANKALADLEKKKAGAKAETIALIAQEQKEIEKLREKDIAGFTIANQRAAARRAEEQAVKNLIMAMEQAEQYQIEFANYLAQVDQARLAAWNQVDALKRQLDLTTQREQLERSLSTLRATDRTAIQDIFNLEQQRAAELKKISEIKDLPYEERLRREQEINAAIDARRQIIENNLAATRAEQESFAIGWDKAFETWRNNLKTDAEYAAAQFNTLTKGFEDAIVKFVQTGKLSFKDLFNSLIAEAVRASANKLLMSIFGSLFGGGGGGSFLGSLFGGFRANGGPVNPGKAYVVGEQGPELFMPKNAGSIVPNGAVIGGGTAVNNTEVVYNIQAVDASSFRQLVARDPEFIFNVTEAGRRSLPTRSRR
jgi:lambda family phage tail tape measure protein